MSEGMRINEGMKGNLGEEEYLPNNIHMYKIHLL